MKKLIADFMKILALKNDTVCTIFTLDELEKKLEMKKKEIIEQHTQKYNIWQASDGRWKTKVPDSTKDSGEKLIAKRKEQDLLDAIIEWYTRDSIPDTLERLFPHWIKDKALDTSKGNANKLLWVWNTYYDKSSIAKKRMKDINALELKGWLLDTIEKNSLTKRKYREMKSVLNMMFDYAVEMDILSKNVSRNVRKISDKHFAKEPKKQVQEHVYINNEEKDLVKICLEQFEKTKNVAYLAICLNTALGLRVGELVALKILDFCDMSVHIERQEIKVYIEKDGKYIRNGYCIDNHTKTPESVRDVPLTSISRYFFKAILDLNNARGLNSEYLLLNDTGERIHNDSINNALRRVNKKINTPQKGNHSLRKTCISKMNASNLLTNEELREFAGHKYISTTQNNYIFQTDTLDDKRIANYEKAINSTNISVTECNLKIQQLKKAGNL